MRMPLVQARCFSTATFNTSTGGSILDVGNA
jgi:hypothetical protein